MPAVKKSPKYVRILKLIKEKPLVTLEKCNKKHPDISSSTFHSIVNILYKHDLVKKIPLDKRRVGVRRTSRYKMSKAKEVLKAERRLGRSTKLKPIRKSGRSSFNPVFTMSLYSLLNALEFFVRREERHRQAAILLMDLAVEYALKAKLYKENPIRFLESKMEHLDLFTALQETKKNGGISRDDEVKLRLVHKTRNYAQHRARIPDWPTTKQYMVWVHMFIHKFALENFNIDIDSQIPDNFLKTLYARA